MNGTVNVVQQTMEIQYDCCGEIYIFELVMPKNGTLLHNSSLADTAIMHCDAVHDEQHSECEIEA